MHTRVSIRYSDELQAWQLYKVGTDELLDDRSFETLEAAGAAARELMESEGGELLSATN